MSEAFDGCLSPPPEWSSDKMVAISFCIKAQGTLDPKRGHLCPDGQ